MIGSIEAIVCNLLRFLIPRASKCLHSLRDEEVEQKVA